MTSSRLRELHKNSFLLTRWRKDPQTTQTAVFSLYDNLQTAGRETSSSPPLKPILFVFTLNIFKSFIYRYLIWSIYQTSLVWMLMIRNVEDSACQIEIFIAVQICSRALLCTQYCSSFSCDENTKVWKHRTRARTHYPDVNLSTSYDDSLLGTQFLWQKSLELLLSVGPPTSLFASLNW